MDFSQVWSQVQGLLWVSLSIGFYLIALEVYDRSGHRTIYNPLCLTVLCLCALLKLTGTSYDEYMSSMNVFYFFLSPALVALALPIYENSFAFRGHVVGVMFVVILGSLFSIISMGFFGQLFDLDAQIIRSLLARSVTTPIGMSITQLIGGIPSITAFATVISGLLGGVFGGWVWKALKIKSPYSRGFSMGLTSHGIGSSWLIGHNKRQGIYGFVMMGLTGMVVSFILPLLVSLWDIFLDS